MCDCGSQFKQNSMIKKHVKHFNGNGIILTMHLQVPFSHDEIITRIIIFKLKFTILRFSLKSNPYSLFDYKVTEF